MNCSTEIKHDEKTIQNLFRTQYYACEKPRIILRFLAGFVLIVIAAVFGLPLWAKGIMIAAGAWLVSTPDFPASVRADKVIQARGGRLPVMCYEFREKNFRVRDDAGGDMTIDYAKIKMLVHDDKYVYIFLNENSVCMMCKPKDYENFVCFIENKTGLKLFRQKNIFAMNIDDIRRSFRRQKNDVRALNPKERT